MMTSTTNMRQAFDRALLKSSATLAFNPHSGINHKARKVNASVSYRTYHQLKNQGILA